MLRLLTWNVWGRFGPWEERAPAIETVLRQQDPDVVCLQEAWNAAGGRSQAELLADALGWHAASGERPSFLGDRVGMGNAVLSRWPVEEAATRWLPRPGGGVAFRHALEVTVAAPWGPVPVFSVHLDWSYDASAARQEQVRELCRVVARRRAVDGGDAYPPVVAGDLNAVPASDEVRMLTGLTAPPVDGLVFTDAWAVAGDGTDGCTWSRRNPWCVDAAWPERRLDYVLVAWPRPKPNGNPLRCQVVATEPVDGIQPSDHYAVIADLAAP
jgi:endonuclease/exonuclease/phosphatase family metal-dependent hydrolase